MEATIKLFKGLLVKSKKSKKASKQLLEETIKRGFIFAPEVIANYKEDVLLKITQGLGVTAEQMNSSFHKSWKKIRDADLEQLVVEQLAHYLTTYGKESPAEYVGEKEGQWDVENLGGKIIGLGDFKSDKVGTSYVYIPKEKLDIPQIEDDIKLVVIKGYTQKELKEKLLALLQLGVALKEDTIEDVMEVVAMVELNEKDISAVRNKEVKVRLYEHLGMLPENPIEFLSFVIYKITGSTLLIKNARIIDEIKESERLGVTKLFKAYKAEYGLERLAEIFYRFKPLFLALKGSKVMNAYINKIRKLAKTYHKPLPEDYLNALTAKIHRGEKIKLTELAKELEKVNIFRKIRLAYALKFRTKDNDSILYKVRNGRGFATDFEFSKKAKAKEMLNHVLVSIVDDVQKNVKGKKIYIPDYIHYSLPATEKQFTGFFPSGTYVSIPQDMVMGIHWKNVKQNRIDLDLSLIDGDGEKIGWDGGYRTKARDILFSGDMTDASGEGASELFYVKKQAKTRRIMSLNYFNYDADTEVPYEIVVAKERPTVFSKDYTLNPNNIMAVAQSKLNQKQQVLGLLVTTTQGSKFYFSEVALGLSITSSANEFVEQARKYLFGFYENTIELSDILEKANAKLVKKKEDCDIDLSPENLGKDTILNLLKKL